MNTRGRKPTVPTREETQHPGFPGLAVASFSDYVHVRGFATLSQPLQAGALPTLLPPLTSRGAHPPACLLIGGRPAELLRHILWSMGICSSSRMMQELDCFQVFMSLPLSYCAPCLLPVDCYINWGKESKRKTSKKAIQLLIHLWLLRSHGRKYSDLFKKNVEEFKL